MGAHGGELATVRAEGEGGATGLVAQLAERAVLGAMRARQCGEFDDLGDRGAGHGPLATGVAASSEVALGGARVDEAHQ